MNPDATRSLSGEDSAAKQSLSPIPILTIKTSFKNTFPMANIHDLPITDGLDEDVASIHRRMESLKLAPPAPALRSHVDLPADDDDEKNSMFAEIPGFTGEVLSPLDLQRRFSLPVREQFSGRKEVPLFITETDQQSNSLVEEPESYTEPSLLLEGVSTDQIKPSAMHLFVRRHKDLPKRDEINDDEMDTTSDS